ncbi:MAG: methyltransferase [Egibacteraceae bacterium]
MRLVIRGENLFERAALRANFVPAPAFESMSGMALSGVLIAITRLGLAARLAQRPATADELADELQLDREPTRLLLDCLHSVGYVDCRQGRYSLSRPARRWLASTSPSSVGQFVASCRDYWRHWSSLPEVLRNGVRFDHHGAGPDDPYWREYITGQFELARLSAPEVAKKVRLPAGARALLDVGGGHGWFAAQVCRRYPGLRATVIDLPGSANVGREIIADAGMSHQVEHRDGDALKADLGGSYDGALCFNLIHHLEPDQIVMLFSKIHAALNPGGSLAVLDLFTQPPGRRPDAAGTWLGLFFYLTSGAQTYSPQQLRDWLREAGFDAPRRAQLRRIPSQTLYQATKHMSSPRPGCRDGRDAIAFGEKTRNA